MEKFKHSILEPLEPERTNESAAKEKKFESLSLSEGSEKVSKHFPINEQIAQEMITENFPEVEIASIERFKSGADNAAFLVNDEIVFRFPMRPTVNGRLQTEIKVLPELEGRLSLPIPHIEYVGKRSGGSVFIGYKYIPGQSLSKKLLKALPDADQARLQNELKTFLEQTHSFPLEKAQELGVKKVRYENRYEKVWQRYRTELKDFFTEKEHQILLAWHSHYVKNFLNLPHRNTFVHGDFTTTHILFDEKTKKINGIIDWTDSGIGDPLIDLVRPRFILGEKFIKPLLPEMSEDEEERSLGKIEFLALVQAMKRLFYFIKTGEREKIKEAQADIKKRIEKRVHFVS